MCISAGLCVNQTGSTKYDKNESAKNSGREKNNSLIMSACILPAEILHEILKHLNGRDVLACSKVCLQWQHAVDSTSDNLWKEICAREYKDVYQNAYRKASLSWRELYTSLDLWSDVSVADCRVTVIPVKDTFQFYTLQNNVVTYPQRLNETKRGHETIGYDTIAYYSLENLEEYHREHFDINFSSYEENENIIVVGFTRNRRSRIRIIPKKNKNAFLEVPRLRLSPWLLLETEIRYTAIRNEHFCSKLIKKDNEITLTDVTKISSITEGIPEERDANILFNAVSRTKARNFIDKYRVASEFKQGNIFIVGVYKPAGMIHIFYNPYDSTGQLKRYKVKPDKSIALDKIIHKEDIRNYKEIKKIDVVETVNGHKVIVLYCRRLFVIDLSHDTSSNTNVSASEESKTQSNCVIT